MATGTRSKYESIVDAIAARLSIERFKRKGPEEFLRQQKPVSHRLRTSLREPTGERVSYVEVFPGFDFRDVEELAATLAGTKPRSGFITCSLNIGLLTPKSAVIEWPLNAKSDAETIAATVLETIDRYAVPFWNEFRSIEYLAKQYEANDFRICVGEYYWRQAAAYCLLADSSRATKLLQGQLTTAKPRAKAAIESALPKIAEFTGKHK